MKARNGLRCAALALLAFACVPVACSADGIVGGDCRVDHLDCHGECVAVLEDSANCGACDHRCSSVQSCVAGRCTLPDGSSGAGGDASLSNDSGDDHSLGGDGANPDGSNPDSSNPDGSNSDGSNSDDSNNSDGSSGDGSSDDSNSDSSVSDGSNPDGSVPDDANPDDANQCLPPFDTAEHCGDCDTRCTPPNDICAPVDGGGYVCTPFCTPPLDKCGSKCVNLNSDPLNCGRCNNICPTRICQSAKCVGASAGHIMLACSDYAKVPGDSPQNVALGNAMFLRPRNPVRILAYQQYAAPVNVSRVNDVIGSIATARSRSFTITPANDAADVLSQLSISNYEVLLVYDQSTAPYGALSDLGSALKVSLDSYSRAGGVVVVLDSGTGTAQMGAFLTNAQLLDVSGEDEASDTNVVNFAPADAIGINVLSPYHTAPNTCTFTTSETESNRLVFVVATPTENGTPNEPVIVHRIQTP